MNYIERKEDYLKGRIIPQTANDDFVEFGQNHVEKLKEIPLKYERLTFLPFIGMAFLQIVHSLVAFNFLTIPIFSVVSSISILVLFLLPLGLLIF